MSNTSNKNSKKKKKSGGSPLPIILFILIVGGVAASNFVGPAKGWMTGDKGGLGASADNQDENTPETSEDNQNETQEDKNNTPTENNTTAKGTDKSTDGNNAGTSDNKAMTEFEKKHKEFYDKYMAKMGELKRLPTKGKSYKVVTSSGDVREGEFVKTEGYSLFLEKIKPYNAKASIHFSKLRGDMARYFFPEKAANTYANKELEKYLAAKNVITVVEEEIAPTPETDKSTASPVSTPTKRISSKKFDPTVAESSPRLAHAAMEVNNYLRNQVRITKKRDKFVFADVEKCHAKQQGASAVFYMYVTPSFAKQSYEYKFQVVDGIRRFWALRCMSNGVAGDSKAFLCIVNGSSIVGGSKITNAEDIYIK